MDEFHFWRQLEESDRVVVLPQGSTSVNMKRATRGGAVWSARMAHNHQVAGSNPAPATKKKDKAFAWSFFCACERGI